MSQSQTESSQPQVMPASLEKIFRSGTEGKTPYPIILNQLIEWGITRYTVDLSLAQILFYDTKGQVYQESASLTPVSVNDNFNVAAIKTALQRRAVLKESSYEEFCHELAAAGVNSYEVVTQTRKIIYKGKIAGQEHTEEVPDMGQTPQSQSQSQPQPLPSSLEKIVKGGKEAKTPYPIILDELTEWGVSYYTVDLNKAETLIYDRKGHAYEEPPSFTPVAISDKFDIAAIKTAIQRRGPLQETSYEEFCHEIAAAGVASYEVSTQPRRCSYKGKTQGQEYSEEIPVIKKA